MSEADVLEISKTLYGVGKEWAEELDARGKPGSEVLSAFTALN